MAEDNDVAKTPAQMAYDTIPQEMRDLHPQLLFKVTKIEEGVDPRFVKGSYWKHCNFPDGVSYAYTFTVPAISIAYVDEIERAHHSCPVCFPNKPAEDNRVAPGA